MSKAMLGQSPSPLRFCRQVFDAWQHTLIHALGKVARRLFGDHPPHPIHIFLGFDAVATPNSRVSPRCATAI